MHRPSPTPQQKTDGSYLSSLSLPPHRALIALVFAAALIASAVMLAPGALAASVVLAVTLAWASLVDIERRLLPDVLTLGLTVCGVAMALAGPAAELWSRSAGAIAGYALPAGIALIYRQIRHRDGLGLGDAKLLAAAGAWLGWAVLPFVLLIAATAGLAFVALGRLFVRRAPDERIAFGPFIAAGFWCCWLLSRSGALSLAPV